MCNSHQWTADTHTHTPVMTKILLLQNLTSDLTGKVKALQGTVNLKMTMTCPWIYIWLNKINGIYMVYDWNHFLLILISQNKNKRGHQSYWNEEKYTETSIHFTATFKSGSVLIQVGITSIILSWFQLISTDVLSQYV